MTCQCQASKGWLGLHESLLKVFLVPTVRLGYKYRVGRRDPEVLYLMQKLALCKSPHGDSAITGNTEEL